MLDTHPDIAARFREMMMRKSGEQRLRMGCSMHESVKQIVRSAICESHPEITEAEMRREIFLRFYGHEFSRDDRERLFDSWRRRKL
jgi:hypothetical protein